MIDYYKSMIIYNDDQFKLNKKNQSSYELISNLKEEFFYFTSTYEFIRILICIINTLLCRHRFSFLLFIYLFSETKQNKKQYIYFQIYRSIRSILLQKKGKLISFSIFFICSYKRIEQKANRMNSSHRKHHQYVLLTFQLW